MLLIHLIVEGVASWGHGWEQFDLALSID